jgi:LysM repeat protein
MRYFLLLIFIGLFQSLYSQEIAKREYEVLREPQLGTFFFHELEKGESIYSLSKSFGIPLSEVKRINPGLDFSQISLGQKVAFPIINDEVLENYDQIKLYYKVKPKETLYTIAKKYFEKDVSTIRNLNNLNSNGIDIGQQLIIGYLPFNQIKPINETFASVVADHSIKNNSSISKKEDQESDVTNEVLADMKNEPSLPKAKSNEIEAPKAKKSILELIDLMVDSSTPEEYETSYSDSPEKVEPIPILKKSESGVAYTENVKVSSDALYVLHPKARVNSEIELSYPMLKTKTKATVISQLPTSLYPENISIVISPGVAAALGAKDTQFRIEMKYVE